MLKIVKVSGFVILLIALVIQFAHLKGYLRHEERIDFLGWARKSNKRLPINTPSAKAFMEQFPPPSNSSPSKITYITKLVVRVQNGLVDQAQINYMYQDNSRTDYVATLGDIENWAAESRYPWIAFILSTIGFVITVTAEVISRKTK